VQEHQVQPLGHNLLEVQIQHLIQSVQLVVEQETGILMEHKQEDQVVEHHMVLFLVEQVI